MPKTVNVDSAHALISRSCVNDCLFCATADKRKNGKFPSKEEILEFIENSRSAGISNMIFSGLGEPTLDPDFILYLQTAGKLGFKTIRVFTNGYGISSEKALQWKETGLTDVLLSIHGTENEHDFVVKREGAYRDVISALEIYSGLGYSISVNTCLTKHNLNGLKKLIGILKNYPIKIHTLAFPEWAGNCLEHSGDLIHYDDLSDLPRDLIEGKDKRTYFDNVPYCLAGGKTIEMRGLSPVEYLDGKGRRRLNQIAGKLYHSICRQKQCPYINRCSGFEVNCIESRGWGTVPDKINEFLSSRVSSKAATTASGANRHDKSRNSSGKQNNLPAHYHRNDLTLVVRTTSRCNIDCVYCSSYSSNGDSKIDIGTMEKIYRVIFDYADNAKLKQICFLWHGGEPLLMGKEFYKKVWNPAYSHKGIEVKHLIQTNLTLMDDQWISLFKEYKVGLGTSVDPIENIRVYRDGREQYDDWLEKLILVCDAGLDVGIVFTVTSHHLDKIHKIYGFFKNIQTISRSSIGIKINPIYPAGKASTAGSESLSISPSEYGEFLCNIWDLWNRDNKPFPISPFREWEEFRNLSCEYAGRCHENFLSVDGRGNIYNCARFADSGLKFGNILTSDIETILQDKNRSELFGRLESLRDQQCRDCNLWDYCHGGCPYFAEIYTGDSRQATAFCDSYKIFFENHPIPGKSVKKAVVS